jgi:hypothetical protein
VARHKLFGNSVKKMGLCTTLFGIFALFHERKVSTMKVFALLLKEGQKQVFVMLYSRKYLY